MKAKDLFIALVIYSWIVSACQPAQITLLPVATVTVSVVPPTNTPIQINTPVPTNTPKPTPIPVLPELLQAFENGGYLDKTPESGDFYAIKIEGQSRFYNGIQYGSIKIFSTLTIARYINGTWEAETILDGVCRTDGPNTNRFGFVDGDNVNKYEACPSPDFFKTKRANIDQLSQGNGNIMEAFYGYDFDPYREMLFESVFPDGATTVEIPGIGTISTITRLKYQDFVAAK